VGVVGRKKTTISVSEETHLELYILKREMGVGSFDEVIKKLIRAYRIERAM
jgi:predicted CopG family antitoxin